MNEQTKALLRSKIDRAEVVSFDIFDTLLFRKTNTPETVFDLVGRHFGINGFRKLRMDDQNEASRRAWIAHQYPHADMDQIYEVMSEHTEIPVDWMAVKAYEIQLERDALVPNTELLEFFRYAKAQGKRVIATSDMYLTADILAEFLREKGFAGLDHLYCSADEHKAKFNRDLFERVARKENVPCEKILHIGDKDRDDGEFPAVFGFDTFVYHRDCDLEKIKNAPGSDVDKGIYKILCDGSRDFWYNLGVEVGGPLYMGLYRWLREKTRNQNRKLFFLSRDGYNLYHICKQQGMDNVEYLYTSRRALTMAAIRDMNEADILSLPPYTFGQTVGEILDYLKVDRSEIRHLEETGLRSFRTVIRTQEDIAAFKKLYLLDKAVFLRRCEAERENARKYYEEIGFLQEDAICFDCGWQGSSQELLERFKKVVGCEKRHDFLYFGIRNAEKSRRQLRNMHYDTYLFDFYKNYALQADMRLNVAMYELFFSAPHESVYYYNDCGQAVFEEGAGDRNKEQLLAGILDFVREGLSFVDTYGVEWTPEISVGHLKRLIHLPTEEEAVTIGDLENVDGFARQQGQTKRIAWVTREWLEENPNFEIYWLNGLLKRPDVPEDLKTDCARRLGAAYPTEVPEYHLEDEQSIRNYHRWLRNRKPTVIRELSYKPSFSVVIPVYNTVTPQLEECIQSVLHQTYDRFELILVDDHSSWDNVVPVLRKYENHEKVRVIYRSVNGHISVATNDGIAIASGEFIVFMDCDDVIEPDALFSFAEKLNENPELDFIYSDEDKLTEDGKIRHMPFFKPEWSPDLFLNMMYTNHLATYRTALVREVGGLRTAFNGSQDYDFTLRFMEKSHNSRVGHVTRVLYHWRERKESVAFAMSSKNYASEAARYAKEDYIKRNGIQAHMEPVVGMYQYRIVYHVVGDPLVSIIIPSKDHPNVLKQCIDSIRAFTDYPNYEIIVVDNGSRERNRAVISEYLEGVGAQYIYHKEEFNFSKMCNTGTARAKGQYLLFLNDDIEIFQPQWLRRMLGHAQQKHTGAVGAKLLYPQSTLLQHTGVANAVAGPLHSFSMCDDGYPYYFGWNWVDNNCIAVTGACLMVDKSKFQAAGGFDEDLPVAYNDVKLCFALHRLGWYNVIRNDAVAYHHESLSRGTDQVDDRKLIRLHGELAKLYADFPELRRADPYLNPALETLTAGLNLRQCWDTMETMDLSGCAHADYATVDAVEVTDRVRIIGWSFLPGNIRPEEMQRYLVFKDPFGKITGARAMSALRPDVAAHFGNDKLRYAGYECVVSKSDLRVDLMVYQIGVLSVTPKGKRYLRWCGETPLLRNPRPRPIGAPFERRTDFIRGKKPADVQWFLDEWGHQDSFFRIRGFAFPRGDRHYRYDKTLILSDGDGNALEFAVQPEERLDVAYTFPREHFLYYTGFVCYVYDSCLEPERTYDVIIRLKNRFDPGDIQDIVTGQKIRLPE